jgi:hypothetical protein
MPIDCDRPVAARWEALDCLWSCPPGYLRYARIQAGLDEADALGGLGEELRTLRAEADRELGGLRAGRSI